MNSRELLFKRHQSIEPKLDRIRESVLSASVGRGSSRAIGTRVESGFIDLLRPFRWHLVGLSATWALVLLLNIGQLSSAPAPVAADTSPQQIFLALRENREQLLQLLDVSEGNPGPTPFVPRRRSELPPLTATA